MNRVLHREVLGALFLGILHKFLCDGCDVNLMIFESWFSNPSEPVSRNVMCEEMTNPEISTVFVLSNLILLAPIFLKLAKSPLSPFDDVALHCDEVNASEMLLVIGSNVDKTCLHVFKVLMDTHYPGLLNSYRHLKQAKI